MSERSCSAYEVLVNNVKVHVDVSPNPAFFKGYWDEFSRGELEPALFRFLRSVVTPEATFLDVGAWVGCMSIFAACSGCKVIAFEADPEAYQHLLRNIAMNPQLPIEARQAFVSSSSGTAHISSQHHGNNGGSTGVIDLGGDSWEVPKVSLQSVCNELKDTRLIIKIDVEGAEYDMLLNGSISFAPTSNTTIVLALHPHIIAQSIRGQSVVSKIRRRWRLCSVHVRLLRRLASLGSIQRFDAEAVRPRALLWTLFRTGDIPLEERDLVLRCS